MYWIKFDFVFMGKKLRNYVIIFEIYFYKFMEYFDRIIFFLGIDFND